MSTSRLFDFAFEFFEVSEHFALLPQWVNPGVSRVVIDKEHVISASAECSQSEPAPIRRNELHRVGLCSRSSLSGTGAGVAC